MQVGGLAFKEHQQGLTVYPTRLANLVLPPPGLKFKASTMPFTQRENISHFLTACETAPLNLPAHDRFLTVDLYDNKDPAQVVQCIGAFSRAANAAKPSEFPKVIGPKRSSNSPSRKAPNANALSADAARIRGYSNASQISDSAHSARSATARTLSPTHTGGSNTSKATDGTPKQHGRNVSTWSKRSDEGATAPAWNIHQYGYMGGASQGNQGISFGARRQITSTVPGVPSVADKERRRREQEAEAERARLEKEDAERSSRSRKAMEEEDAKVAEERRWREETLKVRERQRRELDEQKRQWDDEERRWKETEEQRLKDEEEAEESWRKQGYSGLRSRSQKNLKVEEKDTNRRVSEADRIHELERQLEEAKERERIYQSERESRRSGNGVLSPSTATSAASAGSTISTMPRARTSQPVEQKEEEEQGGTPLVQAGEMESVQQERSKNQATTYLSTRPTTPSRPQSFSFRNSPARSTPPLDHSFDQGDTTPRQQVNDTATAIASTTLTASDAPTTARYSSATPIPATRTDRYLAANNSSSAAAVATPSAVSPRFAREVSMSSTAERAEEESRRLASQARTTAGGVASKSLLEREMDLERERQKEWEETQMSRSTGPGSAVPPPATRPMGPRELRK